MKRKILGLLAAGLLAGPMAANADLIITLTDDGFGGTNLQFNGSGEVLVAGDFVYWGPEFWTRESAFATGLAHMNDLSIAPQDPILGGGVVSSFWVIDGAGLYTIQMSWAPSVGASLSDSNGLIFNLDTIFFSELIQGTYSLTRSACCADVGDVTLVVASTSVPEPGTLALLGLGLVGMGMRRRIKAS